MADTVSCLNSLSSSLIKEPTFWRLNMYPDYRLSFILPDKLSSIHEI